MSKDNMEELQRYQNSVRMQLVPSDKGVWVRFSDVEEREARFQARIKELAQDRDDMTDTILGLRERIEELEGIVSGKTMYDAASVADARWRERIEGKARELDAMAQAQADEFGNYITSAGRSGDYKEGRADAYDDAADALRSLLDSGEEQDEARTGGVGVADMEAMLIRQQALRDHLYEEARRKLSGESGLPVSQGMVRDGEVIARLHNLDSHRNPHWSDEENRAYSLGVRNAIHVIEHPEEENQSAEAGQPRSVLAREGGEE